MGTSMRSATTGAGTMIVMAALLVAVAAAQAPAPGPGTESTDCFTALGNTSDCLTYVEAGSSLKKPEKGCCPELAGLVDSNPICLCQLLSNSSSFGVQVDRSKALSLPSVCAVETPPLSTCSAVGYPIEDVAPTASPMLPPAATPAGAAPDCLTVLANMSDCLTYVQAGSTQKKPDKGCCPELAGLVDSNPICLCQLLSKPDSYGVQVDVTKALKLPSVCSVQTPPVSTCADLGYPIRGMAPSEAPGVAGGDMPPGASPLALASGNQDSGGAYSENAVSLTRLSFLGAAFLTTLVF